MNSILQTNCLKYRFNLYWFVTKQVTPFTGRYFREHFPCSCTMKKISFQGELGAYSHEACKQACPNFKPLPCRTFEDAINEVISGRAELAMLPIENSTYGRVADMHRMLPASDLQIVGETFLRVRISLMAPRGSELSSIQTAKSHIVLLGQCQSFLKKHGIQTTVGGDIAGSAKQIAEGDSAALTMSERARSRR